jgi:hypothetical protein
MVFKMICAFAAMAVVTQWYGATYFSMSRVPNTTPGSTGRGIGSRDDAQPLYCGLDSEAATALDEYYMINAFKMLKKVLRE